MRIINLLVIVTCLVSVAVVLVPASSAGLSEQNSRFFIQNTGQYDPAVKFMLESSHSRLWLAADGLWLTWYAPQASDRSQETNLQSISGVNLHLSFPGADPHAKLQSLERLETQVNYLGGSRALSAATWNSVVYTDLYPGIDLVIEAPSAASEAEVLSWRLVAGPTADLSQVRLRLAGADTLQVMSDRLLLDTPVGELILPLIETQPGRLYPLPAAQVFQPDLGLFEIQSPFTDVTSRRSPAFQVNSGSLTYSTFLGGSAWEVGYGIALGQDGSIYVAGRTASLDFPTTAGVFDRQAAQIDAFIVKLDATGQQLIYATLLGGKGMDAAYSIALIGDQATVTGETQSPDFPTTRGAFDTTCGSEGTCDSGGQGPFSDAFLAQLNSNGSLLTFSTFLGGKEEDSGYGVAMDDQRFYLTGITYSSDFPAPGYKANGDAFVISFDSSHKLAYATLLGGSDVEAGFAIAVLQGEAFITGETSSPDFPAQSYQGGRDLLLARLDPSGSLVNVSLMGGSGEERGNAIAFDPTGNVAVVGWTTSPDLPATAGVYGGNGDVLLLLASPQAEVVKLVYFGGTAYDEARGIASTATGSLWITGSTNSQDFPVSDQAFQPAYGGSGDAFVAHLKPSASEAMQLLYSSYLGGSGEDSGQALAIFQADQVYLTGYTRSGNFPLTSPNLVARLNGTQDAFICSLKAIDSPGPIPILPSPIPTLVPPTLTVTLELSSPTAALPTSVLVAANPTSTTDNQTHPLPATSIPAGDQPTLTPISQDTPGTPTATIQPGSPADMPTKAPVAGKTLENRIAETSIAPSVGMSTPILERETGQNSGRLWLIALASLVLIGLVAWFVYQRKHA